MHFQFRVFNDKIIVWFVSSKESIRLGTLRFVDDDEDIREDVQRLLNVTIQNANSPMLKVIEQGGVNG